MKHTFWNPSLCVECVCVHLHMNIYGEGNQHDFVQKYLSLVFYYRMQRMLQYFSIKEYNEISKQNLRIILKEWH